MLVKGINQRKHYSEANPFNARLNVFVSICSVGKKALRQLSQKKSQSNHHKISLTLTRVRIQNSLDWKYPGTFHTTQCHCFEKELWAGVCWLFFFFSKINTLIVLIYFQNEKHASEKLYLQHLALSLNYCPFQGWSFPFYACQETWLKSQELPTFTRSWRNPPQNIFVSFAASQEGD